MKKIFLIFALIINLFAVDDATTTIENKGASSLPSMVVVATNGLNNEFENKFFKLMVGDLKVGATFAVSDEKASGSWDGAIQSETKPQMIVKYALDGKTSLKVKVTDPNSKVLFEGSFSINDASRYPFLAHKAVSEIVKQLGYANVDWMNKMLLIANYTSPGNSQILVADYTLTYRKVLIKGGLNIFPKWANNAQSAFYYTHYDKKSPAIYKYTLATGAKKEIIKGEGMLIASDVSADGSKLLITDAPKDQADIYLYNLATGSKKQITHFSGIDVNGNFIDNDSRVVFVSDRLGYPNIFVTGLDGQNVEQLVFHGKNNNSLSTNGSYIVYSSRDGGGGFNLYLISTKTDAIRQLTADGKNTFPKFSDDGGSIVYIKSDRAVGVIRVNENKSFQFPLNIGKIQSIDW